MSFLEKIIDGVQERKPKLIIAGQPAVGKSTFASGFPKAVFLTAEDRTSHLDIKRVDLGSWAELLECMVAVGKGEGEFETLVIDTLDALEPLLFAHLCEQYRVSDVLEIGGGFFQFRKPMIKEWKKFINIVDKLSARGVQVVMLAHTQVKTFSPPDGASYDRYTLKLDSAGSDFLTENVDLIGYAHFKVHVAKEGQKSKAKTTGKREMAFKHNPAYPAKQGVKVADKCALDYEEWLTSLT